MGLVDDVAEQRDLMKPPPMPWRESKYVPLLEKIYPQPPDEITERWFLDVFRELRGGR